MCTSDPCNVAQLTSRQFSALALTHQISDLGHQISRATSSQAAEFANTRSQLFSDLSGSWDKSRDGSCSHCCRPLFHGGSKRPQKVDGEKVKERKIFFKLTEITVNDTCLQNMLLINVVIFYN